VSLPKLDSRQSCPPRLNSTTTWLGPSSHSRDCWPCAISGGFPGVGAVREHHCSALHGHRELDSNHLWLDSLRFCAGPLPHRDAAANAKAIADRSITPQRTAIRIMPDSEFLRKAFISLLPRTGIKYVAVFSLSPPLPMDLDSVRQLLHDPQPSNRRTQAAGILSVPVCQ